ncbi:MAG: AmmeMemoRadiSam system protein B, partial [Micrococcales bacterium]|nr:AmmeMemoRadiSam system protein B [Micrococcales bacterium]
YATLPAAANAIKQVVLLGQCHRVGLPGLALPGVDAMATPLGEVPVWAEGAELVSHFEQVVTAPEVHAEEHSLEVHLPFLQRTLPDTPVLPIAVGWAEPEQVAEVIDTVWGGPETLVIVSSDLSHYHSYGQAKAIDQQTVKQIVRLSPPLDHDQACGAGPINGLTVVGARRHLIPSVVGLCSSGDTSFDHSRVVGYTFIRFDEPEALNG